MSLSEEELRRRRRDRKRRDRARWRAQGLPPGDPRHGTTYGYDRGCREECCRGAQRVVLREVMRQRARRTLPEREAAARARREEAEARRAAGLPPGDPRHGSPSAYGYWRCRCDACRAGNAARGRRHKAKARARQR